MSFDDLRNQLGCGATTGALGYGDKLTPTTIRKHACHAGIIPTVLGVNNDVLDQGRMVRLFTPAQEAALRERDRHCTFPGCTTPAKWTEKHHLTHWIDGGATGLDNGCLLCARHHTIVHRDELAGQVVGNEVVWDLTPGSYRQRLENLRNAEKLTPTDPGKDPTDDGLRCACDASRSGPPPLFAVARQ